MATQVKTESSDTDVHHAQQDEDDISAAEAAIKARLARKRTKTGCLTCRKRRIKCGEERPVCKNCIKSKRHCEGYNPRVTFKAPPFDYQPAPNGGAHITFHAGPPPGTGLPAQVPAPAWYPTAQPMVQSPQGVQYHPIYQQPIQQVHINGQYTYGNGVSSPNGLQQQHQLVQHYNTPMVHPAQVDTGHIFTPAHAVQPSPHYATDGMLHPHVSPVGAHPPDFTNGAPSISSTSVSFSTASGPTSPAFSTAFSNTFGPSPISASLPTESNAPWNLPPYVPRPELSRPIDYREPFSAGSDTIHDTQPHQYTHMAARAPTPDYYDLQTQVPTGVSPTQMLKDAAVEIHDDDYWDVESDEEMDTVSLPLPVQNHARFLALSRVLATSHIGVQGTQLPAFTSYLRNGILDHYRAEQTANPLRNPNTARVFAHFVSFTGPTLSIYERDSGKNFAPFSDGFAAIPFSQQGLWTYTMPMAALRHQGLLHAMLALSSLQIARMQRASTTPSMQHYAWALKRIRHCVGHPQKRLHITTIAATMLLGFYEVMNADHLKWNSHLAGAKQLFLETDFVSQMARFTKMKAERASRTSLNQPQTESTAFASAEDAMLDQIPLVDSRIVSHMAGTEVRYDLHGSVGSETRMPAALDLSKFEALRDLYWWYLKQDCFQSLVSGNMTLLPFSRWTACAPRAPLGDPNAVYGTHDHLVLLLGRIATFAVKDRARKVRQIEVNGGQWRPAPGMKMPRSPSSQNAPGAAPPQPMQQPAFFGMAPSQPHTMPDVYKGQNNMDSPRSTRSQDPIDLQAATQAALEEYGKIRSALHTFSANLGAAFQPLSSADSPTIQTAFGTALVYRSYDIAMMWAMYNLAIIVAIRSHPHMPPAAHVAAAVAAHETAFFANEVSRIAEGIVPPPFEEPMSAMLASALSDSILPVFFAAVQYQKADQRRATVERICRLSQRIGWGSGEVVANGCETSWIRAAEAGRGPPYQRIARQFFADDPRLTGSWERLDPNKPPDEQDEYDRRFISTKPQSRVMWAMGLLGNEDDMKRMNLED